MKEDPSIMNAHSESYSIRVSETFALKLEATSTSVCSLMSPRVFLFFPPYVSGDQRISYTRTVLNAPQSVTSVNETSE